MVERCALSGSDLNIKFRTILLTSILLYGHTRILCSTSMDQPGKVANPGRGQLNRKNEYFPVRVRA